MATALEITDLCVEFDGVHALVDINVSLDAGQTLAIIGPNGSGKSSLLGAIGGLLPAAAGAIDTASVRPSFVLQSTDVDRSVPITVRETVTMGRYADAGLFRRLRTSDRDAIAGAMDRLEVTDLADRQLHDLSGGQRQRVLVAQGLAQRSSLLLLDEPVNGLDLASRQVIFDVVAEERSKGTAVLITTHDLEDARRCDQVLLLSTRQIAYGTPAEVITEPHLREAFRGRVLRVDGGFVLDDPHHVH